MRTLGGVAQRAQLVAELVQKGGEGEDSGEELEACSSEGGEESTGTLGRPLGRERSADTSSDAVEHLREL